MKMQSVHLYQSPIKSSNSAPDSIIHPSAAVTSSSAILFGHKKAVANPVGNNNRKRSLEPRPHPAKLLNKRYWDDVRAGRVKAPTATNDAETNNATLAPTIKKEIGGGPTPHKKRRSTTLLGFGMANQQQKQPQRAPPSSKISTLSIAANTGEVAAVSMADTILPPATSSVVSLFSPVLPPPPPPAALFRFGPPLPPPAPGFVPPLFGPPRLPPPPPFLFPPPPPCGMLLSPPPATQPPATATAWLTMLEMLASSSATPKILTEAPIGKLSSSQPPSAGSRLITSTASKCSSNARETLSTSDAQIDEMMDKIVQSPATNRKPIMDLDHPEPCLLSSPIQNPSFDRRLCILPLPMPVPIPFPVTTEFILRHFGPKVAAQQIEK